MCPCMLPLQKLEQQLAAVQVQAESAAQKAAAASELAEARLKEKAAADKEWGRRLSARDKEASAKLRDAEAKLKEVEQQGEMLLSDKHARFRVKDFPDQTTRQLME